MDAAHMLDLQEEFIGPQVLTLARLALEWAEAEWGPEATGTLIAADHLGRVLSAAGHLEEAEVALHRALDGLEKSLG
eukprot:CAMPEP_0197676372 /NCGR_PEP_ID=MMETSP1338-20131121/86674_1 /TAXON_ID=43686 ORGANISM="Pelagodinium beii, Strain RCC1491" /NCGR_SAMPLE_ID=MMETSP1338 /ASSEMBLY_ACC=CAM_ASM_000754 /LENGTH=76 /DNA_ID=CAMNT_0043257033 /DNA_START=88 /DNA_END=316 /DNA_ORIENTATION=+